MKIIIIIALVLWIGSAAFRAWRKVTGASEPAPEHVVDAGRALFARERALRRPASKG